MPHSTKSTHHICRLKTLCERGCNPPSLPIKTLPHPWTISCQPPPPKSLREVRLPYHLYLHSSAGSGAHHTQPSGDSVFSSVTALQNQASF